MTSEQVHSDKDIELFVVAGMAGLGTRPMVAREDFRRWLAEHDAQLVEKLADDIELLDLPPTERINAESSAEVWLRARAAELREGEK